MKDFKEINENKESVMDNTEKPRNQILQTPEDYEDDFDKKVDSAGGEKDKNRFDNKWYQNVFSRENVAKGLTVMEMITDLGGAVNAAKEEPNHYEDLVDVVQKIKAESYSEKTVYDLLDDMGYEVNATKEKPSNYENVFNIADEGNVEIYDAKNESETEEKSDMENVIVDTGQIIAEFGSDEDAVLGMEEKEQEENDINNNIEISGE